MVATLSSRRSFLSCSAGSLIAAGSLFRASAQELRQTWMYVGCYTARGPGISRYRLDSATGTLTLVDVMQGLQNPSFLAIEPSGRYLYSVNEIGNYENRQSGSVTAFSIGSTGNLTLLNRQPTEGQNPAHLSVDPTGRFVLAANYSGGNVAALPILANGELAAPTSVVRHQGTLGPNTGRQEAAHAHMILPDLSGRYVLANDLGLDRTFIYRLDGTNGSLVAGDPQFSVAEAGAGPRHLAFHPNGQLVFVLNELNSTLRSYTWDPDRGLLGSVQSISTLPEGYKGVNTTAHVVVAPSGRFVYASNRGHDSIAVFSLDPSTGRLTAVERVWTMGETPRNMAIDPSGEWMFVAHQNTDNIVGFRVNQSTGRLTPTGQFIGTGQPVCIVFLPPPAAGNSTVSGVTFNATPSPAFSYDASGNAQTTLSWNAPSASNPEIRVGSATGPSMGFQPKWGSTTTGKWVADGMMFYLQDGATTLGTVTVRVRQG